MKSTKELVTFLKSVNTVEEKDELAIEAYLKRRGFKIRFHANNTHTHTITFEDFVNWFENKQVSKNDIVIFEDGGMGIVKQTTMDSIILGAYLKKEKLITTDYIVPSTGFCLANSEEKQYLQRILNNNNYSWNKHKLKLVKRIRPVHNQHVRISILGEKLGYGVVKEIKNDGQVIMFIYMKIDGSFKLSLYEIIGNERDMQFEDMTISERKIFSDSLMKRSGRTWNGHLKRIEPLNFKGKTGDCFYFINLYWEIENAVEDETPKKWLFYKSCNYFRNRKDCLQILALLHSEKDKYPRYERVAQGTAYYVISENWEIKEYTERNNIKDHKLNFIGNYFPIFEIAKTILVAIQKARKNQLLFCHTETINESTKVKPRSLKKTL